MEEGRRKTEEEKDVVSGFMLNEKKFKSSKAQKFKCEKEGVYSTKGRLIYAKASFCTPAKSE